MTTVALPLLNLTKNTFLTDGGKIRRLASVTDTRNLQQMRRLANILDSMGVYQELKKMGLKENDTILVAHIETTYLGIISNEIWYYIWWIY